MCSQSVESQQHEKPANQRPGEKNLVENEREVLFIMGHQNNLASIDG